MGALMKKLVLGLALATLATTASAGALNDPIIADEVIVQATAASSISHAIIPPLFFLMFATIAIFF